MAISKKEKGTVNSTQDSVKNQVQDTKFQAKMKFNILTLISNLEKNLLSRLHYLSDSNEIRAYQSYIRDINHIKLVINKQPITQYMILQSITRNTYIDAKNKGCNPKRVDINFSIKGLFDIEHFKPIVYVI